MNRDTFREAHSEGLDGEAHGREQLRVEIATMTTTQRVGVGYQPADAEAYRDLWVKALQADVREIHRAAAEADRISKNLLRPAREQLRDLAREARSPNTRPAPERAAPERPCHASPAGAETRRAEHDPRTVTAEPMSARRPDTRPPAPKAGVRLDARRRSGHRGETREQGRSPFRPGALGSGARGREHPPHRRLPGHGGRPLRRAIPTPPAARSTG